MVSYVKKCYVCYVLLLLKMVVCVFSGSLWSFVKHKHLLLKERKNRRNLYGANMFPKHFMTKKWEAPDF